MTGVRRNWTFSCGHEFIIVRVPKPGLTLEQMPNTHGEPKTSRDQCFECKEVERQAEQKKKERREQFGSTIRAYKDHAAFVKLQIESPAAIKDAELKSSFETCYRGCILKQASNIKKLIDEDYGDGRKTSLASLGRSARSELYTLRERFGVLEEAATFERDLDMARHGTHNFNLRLENVLELCRRIHKDVEKLREDYENALADFEKRFENIIESALRLANMPK
jgi:hypothetical protein